MDMAAAKRAQSETFKTKETRDVEAARLKRRYRKAMIRVRSDLSAVYIGAIRSKVELLEEINSATTASPSPAKTMAYSSDAGRNSAATRGAALMPRAKA